MTMKTIGKRKQHVLQVELHRLMSLEIDEVLVLSEGYWYQFGQENWLALNLDHFLETKGNKDHRVGIFV